MKDFELESNRIIANGCRLVGLVFSHPESGYDCFDWLKYERLLGDFRLNEALEEEHF